MGSMSNDPWLRFKKKIDSLSSGKNGFNISIAFDKELFETTSPDTFAYHIY